MADDLTDADFFDRLVEDDDEAAGPAPAEPPTRRAGGRPGPPGTNPRGPTRAAGDAEALRPGLVVRAVQR